MGICLYTLLATLKTDICFYKYLPIWDIMELFDCKVQFDIMLFPSIECCSQVYTNIVVPTNNFVYCAHVCALPKQDLTI